MFEVRGERVRLLDAGAAVGSLTAAWVAEICERKRKPKAVQLTAYELDDELGSFQHPQLPHHEQTLVDGVAQEDAQVLGREMEPTLRLNLAA
jgi:hypothetical protein